jgi:Invasin, domain 3/Bacterial Ig-like domain (group 3)
MPTEVSFGTVAGANRLGASLWVLDAIPAANATPNTSAGSPTKNHARRRKLQPDSRSERRPRSPSASNVAPPLLSLPTKDHTAAQYRKSSWAVSVKRRAQMRRTRDSGRRPGWHCRRQNAPCAAAGAGRTRLSVRSQAASGIALAVLSIVVSWSLFAVPARAVGSAAHVVVQLSPSSIVANGVSTSTATATVTAADGTAVPGDTVVFSSSDPRESIGSTTDNGNGTYMATITSSTKAGQVTITATDMTANLSGQATLTQAPGSAAHIAVALSPSSIVANGSSTSTATATVTDANGNPVAGDTVVFSSSDPGEGIGPVTNQGDGSYSAVITSSTAVGRVRITATDGTVSGHAALTQLANGSTTTLLTIPKAAVTNQQVILVATVTSSSSGAAPSGIVSFEDAGAPIEGCTDPIPALGQQPGQSVTETCETSFAASTSPEQLAAVYTPGAGSSVAGSAGAATLEVGLDSTSIALDVSNPAVAVDGSATYTATVAPVDGGAVQPSGAVQFIDGGSTISSCASQPLRTVGGAATATCTVPYSTTGEHSIVASYGGDGNFSGAVSPPQAVNVIRLPRQVLGTIVSIMRWTFYYTPSYTKVVALLVKGAPLGATVLTRCIGQGCPFARRVTGVTKAERCKFHGKQPCSVRDQRTIDLSSPFHNHRLRVGARIIVELTRPDWIGKYYMFKVRSRQGPSIKIECLAPGATQPGVGC